MNTHPQHNPSSGGALAVFAVICSQLSARDRQSAAENLSSGQFQASKNSGTAGCFLLFQLICTMPMRSLCKYPSVDLIILMLK
jgi:hypothetical protein